jgi:putative YphP/YqiW family bacilliredoxin
MAGVSGVNFALTGKKANKFLARNLYVTNKTNDMPYPEFMVAPMRRELTDLGFEELKTPEDVQSFFNRKDDLALVVVNSVCGCAASNARPGVRKALEHPQAPSAKVTVFAGMETDAVDEMRTHFLPYPPSSPCIALFKGGQLLHLIERNGIEGQSADQIAARLSALFEEVA